MQKIDYVVLSKGFVGGIHREKGEIVSMTEKEAKYLLMAGVVGAKKAATRSQPAGPTKPAKKND